MPKAFIDFEPIKNLGELKLYTRRLDYHLNDSNPDFHPQIILGNKNQSPVDYVKLLLKDQKIDPNTTIVMAGQISATMEWFENDYRGRPNQIKLDQWLQKTLDWLIKRYGQNLFKVVLHAAPRPTHLHFLILPLDDDGHLNDKLVYIDQQMYPSFLSDFQKAFTDLGFETELTKRKPTFQELAEYYQVTNTPNPVVPECPTVTAPLPQIRARFDDYVMKKYAADCASLTTDSLAQAASPLIKSLSAERKRLRLVRQDISKQLNKREKDLAWFDEQTRSLKPSPRTIATLFEAKVKDGDYILPDSTTLTISRGHWSDPSRELSGETLLELLAYLLGLPADDSHLSAHLEALMPDQDFQRIKGAHMAFHANPQPYLKKPFGRLTEDAKSWPILKESLGQFAAPEILEKLHQDGLLYAGQWGQAVFPCPDESGAFLAYPAQKGLFNNYSTIDSFNLNWTVNYTGTDCLPWVVTGKKGLVLTADPLEAIHYHSLPNYAGESILALGPRPNPQKILNMAGETPILAIRTGYSNRHLYRLFSSFWPDSPIVKLDRHLRKPVIDTTASINKPAQEQSSRLQPIVRLVQGE